MASTTEKSKQQRSSKSRSKSPGKVTFDLENDQLKEEDLSPSSKAKGNQVQLDWTWDSADMSNVTIEVVENREDDIDEKLEGYFDDGLPEDLGEMGVYTPKKVDEPEKKTAFLSVLRLFSYATSLDWLIMALGTITAILQGFTFPAFSYFLGDFINIFVSQDISHALNRLTNNFTNVVDCNKLINDSYINLTLIDIFGPQAPCEHRIAPGSTLTPVIESCFPGQASCTSDENFLRQIDIAVFVSLGLSVASLFFAAGAIALFQLADERQVKKIRLAFFKSILQQEVGWFDAHSGGELASRISDDIERIYEGIGDKLSLMIIALASFTGGFIIAFIVDWQLTLLLLLITPFLMITGLTYTKISSSLAGDEQKQYAAAGAVAEEVLSSIRTVVAFGGETKESERYNKRLKEARSIGVNKGLVLGLIIGIFFFLFFLTGATALWFGAYLASTGRSNAGKVLIVFFSVFTGAFSLGQSIPNIESVLTAGGVAGAIFDIIQRRSKIDPSSEEGEKPETFKGNIEFKNIFFSYPTRSDVQVMNNFSLNIEVGKTYALVGPSGCGKSTVIQLLQRFYDPDAGEVRVGGKNIQSLNIKWLRKHIGLVSQEPILFDTTIAENILYGKEGATMEEVKKAAMDANAHDFISQLPKGYDTLVGEGGTQLSGGQKQRIAIARAIIRDPKILLLDEATSALDTESESIVQQALDRARAGRTTIVIAHRLSTIRNADVIAAIQNGRISEMGTHLELMDQRGLYYELVTAQLQGVDEAVSGIASDSCLHEMNRDSEGLTEQSRSGSNFMHSQSFTDQGEEGGNGDIPELKKSCMLRLANYLKSKWCDVVSFFHLLKANNAEWWIILIGCIAAVINGSVLPVFSIIFANALGVFAVPPQQLVSSVTPWAAVLLGVGILSGISNFCRSLCFSVSGEYLTARLRKRSFKAMLRQEIGWFDDEKNSTGALVTRLADDAAKVQGATGTRLGTIAEVIFSMLTALVICFAYSWLMALVLLGMFPLFLISAAIEVTALEGHNKMSKKAFEKAGSIAVDSIANIRTVASLGLEERFYSRYEFNVNEPYRKALYNTGLHGAAFGFSQGIIYVMCAVIFRFGAFQILQEPGTVLHTNFINVIVVFSAFVFGAYGAGSAGAYAPNFAKAKVSAARIFHLLDRRPIIDSYSEDGEKMERVTGDISTHDLIFRYPTRPKVTVLKGLEVSVNSGQTLALVGPSGCGKSTVVSLLERFYEPSGGVLALDGTDISDLNIQWLRQQIGLVSQEPVLFECSIGDNIRYGANFREVTQEEVIEAAKAANIHKFIESLPKGYNTNAGTKGTQLSGGQKQRIAIARALVRDPKILLLDEATSALDTESEKIVQEALDKAREGRTSIVIAHRLSTIYNSNCIAVISGGKVAESGTHRELMEKKGIYHKLNRFQEVKKKQATYV